MSGASIGGRVAAFVRTPLGDRRPYAGGHWLKTLSVLDRVRIWWAETDAAEEYEDALLAAFAGAVPAESVGRLHDPAVVLPFANLQTADGVRKNHGIRGSLLADEAAGPVTDADRRAAGRAATARADGRPAGRAATRGASDPTRNTGILRSRTVLGAAGSAMPRPRPTRATVETAAARAARNARETGPTVGRRAQRAPTRLSSSGLQALRDELEQLTTIARPAIVARISAARELGDLKENSDYQEARREQSFAEGRIRAIEDLLRHVEVIEDGHDEGRARLGSTVVVEDAAGVEDRFTLVGSSEANPAVGRISASSPIGAALLDRSAGDEVEVVIPSGRRRYRIIEVS